MDPDDHVCLCFHVSLRKIRAYLRSHDPAVASLLAECFGAGTGCGWCVPFLRHLHDEHRRGIEPDLRISPQRYAQERVGYHRTGVRALDPEQTDRSTGPEAGPTAAT